MVEFYDRRFNFDTAYFFNTVNSGTNDRTAVFVGSDKTVLIYGNYTLFDFQTGARPDETSHFIEAD